MPYRGTLSVNKAKKLLVINQNLIWKKQFRDILIGMLIQNFNTKKDIFLIAEIGNNHEGKFELAKKLIYLAKKNSARSKVSVYRS